MWIWYMLSVTSRVKCTPACMAWKFRERGSCLECLPRHLTTVQNDEVCSKIVLVFQNRTLSRPFTALPKWNFLEHGKKKSILKVENLSNLEQMIRNGGIQKNLKSKTQSVDSNVRPRCEGSGKTKNLPTLAPRVEGRNENLNPPRGGRGV
ncbi:hypothetical protein AVEN_89563-1 [Araneus ventricosus]|uniref:Uncharacterized protein n=1 Tax=Araneus ventricosus TaxID=182803 RepID=A0A4Y2GS47_ARAVE|nr:hypothetical protein AVEN_89563-1 [Araneus ventricosus]